MKNIFKRTVFTVCFLATSLTLAGCSTAESNRDAELNARIASLEAENKALKSEITALKISSPKSTVDTDTAATSTSSAGSAQTESESYPNFADIAETPTKDMIEDLAKLHIFDSLESKSQFLPDKAISRAEYIEWLYKAYNALEPESKQLRFAAQTPQAFKDCPPDNPYYKYVQALANAGYSIGYEDGTFRPDKPLTRQEMLGIKVGLDVGKTLPPWRSQMESVWKFSDAKDVDERFTGYVHQDYYVSGPHGSNIQRAFGKIGTFRPKQSVTRSEAAATLWQMGQFGDLQKTNAAAVLKQGKAES